MTRRNQDTAIFTQDSIRGRDGATDKIRLCIVEEQEILLNAYKSSFPDEPAIEIVGITGQADIDAIIFMMKEAKPDAILLGTKVLRTETIGQIEVIRDHFPEIGVILFSTLYDVQAIKELRAFTRRSAKGCAFLLKNSIDRISQLTQVVRAVVEGQVILDSVVMESLIDSGEVNSAFLRDLTNREMEVLSLMAKGYRNATIAQILCVDPKTIERHINSIYSKLRMAADSKHPRVAAIMLYLNSIGHLLSLPDDEYSPTLVAAPA